MTASLKRQAAVQRQVEEEQRRVFGSFFDSIERETPAVAWLRRASEQLRQMEGEQ